MDALELIEKTAASIDVMRSALKQRAMTYQAEYKEQVAAYLRLPSDTFDVVLWQWNEVRTHFAAVVFGEFYVQRQAEIDRGEIWGPVQQERFSAAFAESCKRGHRNKL